LRSLRVITEENNKSEMVEEMEAETVKQNKNKLILISDFFHNSPIRSMELSLQPVTNLAAFNETRKFITVFT